MMRNVIVPVIAALCMFGCAKTASEARNADAFKVTLQPSKEMAEIDTDLDLLDMETQNLKESYEKIQASVLPHVTLESDRIQAKQLVVYINANSVLIVNDTPMSKNDFTQYTDKMLPALCTPTPRLTIHPKAIYDTAAWVLDSIYSHGCSNVNVE